MPKTGDTKGGLSKNTPKSPKKSVKAKPSAATKKQAAKTVAIAQWPRRLQSPKAIWYKPLTWRHRPPIPAYSSLPKARLLFVRAVQQLWRNKKLFAGIVALYGLLNLVLVRSIAGSSNLSNFRTTLTTITHGFSGKVITSTGSFLYLLSTSGSGNSANSGVYQFILLLVCSLAFIWALRQTLAKHTVRVRDSFYRGMYPLIPFLLVLLLIVVQLLPLTIGGGLYSAVALNGIAAHWWEQALWLALFIILGLWSLRMISASLFALYIVTLPDMTPLLAYRNAKSLVYGRRLLIWRKLIFMPIVLFLVAMTIELPLIFYATPAAPWVFFVLSMLVLPLAHGYVYNLYREML